MKACVFFGHGKGDYKDKKKELTELISALIEKECVTQFYSGGRGNFDQICSSIVSDLKKKYPYIKNTLFYSYIPKKDEYGLPEKYDDSIYVLEKIVPPKYAILKTNEQMIEKSDFVVVAVCHSYGGAYRAYRYAKRKKKVLINVYKTWKE